MPALLDAHAHFFTPGYVSLLPESCRRVQPDEFTLYTALAKQHEIVAMLAVGYEDAPWAAGNNAYLAQLAHQAPWVRPVAYAGPAGLTTARLEAWQAQGFVGVSLYLTNEARVAQLAQVPQDVWAWLAAHHWLLSVNSRSDLWAAWQPVLIQNPALRVLASHLGRPPTCAAAPAVEEAAARLAPLTRLAAYSGVHVKLSGLYGLTEPGYDYPHRAAWPYIETVAQAFGPERLLWGSDFSPALEHVSFAQTVGVVEHLKWLTADERTAILGGNLARLLQAVISKEGPP